MTTFLADPYGLEFKDWAAMAAEQLAVDGIKAPSADVDWRSWAAELQLAPDLAILPDPYGFDTWQAWASSVIETIF